jgi:hypothetical protein
MCPLTLQFNEIEAFSKTFEAFFFYGGKVENLRLIPNVYSVLEMYRPLSS